MYTLYFPIIFWGDILHLNNHLLLEHNEILVRPWWTKGGRGGVEREMSFRPGKNWERDERWQKRAVPLPSLPDMRKKAFILTSMGRGQKGGRGLFLLRPQQPSRRHSERQETDGASCSLAQRGSPDLQNGEGRRGLTTAPMTPLWRCFNTSRQSYWKWPGPLASSELVHPQTAFHTPGAMGAAGTRWVRGWTRLRRVLHCSASGEMAPLHQLDDKTLLMAPIKKCECNFLLLVISTVFGILFNRSTGQSRSLLKPSLSFLCWKIPKMQGRSAISSSVGNRPYTNGAHD